MRTGTRIRDKSSMVEENEENATGLFRLVDLVDRKWYPISIFISVGWILLAIDYCNPRENNHKSLSFSKKIKQRQI